MIMYPKRAAAGTYLFWEGEETGKPYYIRSGRVKLRKTTEDGKDLILSILQQGDMIGEMEGYGEFTHTYSAEVIADADIGVVQQKDLPDINQRAIGTPNTEANGSLLVL
jgi:CRP-like cAMP-binding protein